MNVEAENQIMARYLGAIHQMLLRGKALKPGLSLIAGDRRTPDNPLQVAMAAKDSDEDIVHLGFERINGEYRFVELTLYAPRDGATHIISGCRLYIGAGNGRALVLPPIGQKGSFRAKANEIVHLRRVPSDRDQGIQRADERLQALLRSAGQTSNVS
ncbi:hypothetical protein GCM10022600_18570 [Qipengyuania pelagi]|uniref:Uncharacterized protein n=1 Tax=Qipengyuania pelagi TaxID=994320 RepID=A0A844Y456_9SPHN|nr:hypothetical protein [Qipengyuania pelagi]MXO53290.1 hypothetical protein [Qipengyuania pelagi]